VKPVPLAGKPALKIGSDLVVADLHLGFEFELWKEGIKVPIQFGRILSEIPKIAEDEGIERIIINGDLKHQIGYLKGRQEILLKRFVGELSKKYEVLLIKGNHDGGIDFETRNETILAGAGIFHGHAYPSEEMLKTDYWVIAHIHPMFGFTDRSGRVHREPCWLSGTVNRKTLKERYGMSRKIKLIVMPAFSGLVGGTCVNLEGMRGIAGKLITEPKFFLLDGTEV